MAGSLAGTIRDDPAPGGPRIVVLVRGEGPTVQLPRAEVLRVMRRAGLSHLADQLAAELPEVVDLDRERPVFDRHGVNLDMLVNTMGGSP
jgi:hypothetical protein